MIEKKCNENNPTVFLDTPLKKIKQNFRRTLCKKNSRKNCWCETSNEMLKNP